MDHITDAQWAQFEEQGWLNLGRVLNDSDLAALQQRIDDIMLGRAAIDYDRMLMQLDSIDGRYDHAGVQSRGHKGSTLNYRKIQDLEYDPLYLAFMQRPIFRDACARIYGPEVPIAAFRAMFMNKPAGRGTWLPWHQDRWHHNDRDPLLTVWTALDPATQANGCVQIIPGSHKRLVNPDHCSGFLTDEQSAEILKTAKPIHLELAAGEVALLHNWLLHASDVNRSGVSRRAFSTCYMDARTLVHDKPCDYTRIFGPGALELAEPVA
jgi:phytanoyl-CoA hydroxylase